MLVIVLETRSSPGGRVRWAGRRHDDDRPDATSGSSPAQLLGAVFPALHDGEQVALGLDCPLSVPVPPNGSPVAVPNASEQGLAELGQLLGELGTWRPWTTVSTSLPRWRANTSILVWQAVPAPGSTRVAAGAAADSFFGQLRFFRRPGAAAGYATDPDAGAGAVVNLAAAAARRAGLFVDAAELSRPAVSITVTGS